MLTACTRAAATTDSVTPVDTEAPAAFTVQVDPPTVPPTSAATTVPPAPTIPVPVISNDGPISINDDQPDGSFHLDLAPVTTAQVRDLIVSWALVSHSEFRSTAAEIAANYAELVAAAAAAAAAAAPAPAGPELVPPTTQPPPPPPPPPAVWFQAQQLDPSAGSDGQVRVQIVQQLGVAVPYAWSLAVHADVEGNAVLSSALIDADAREAFDAALRAALGSDAAQWTHPAGTITAADLTFDADGNLAARLPSSLTLSEGQATVTLTRDVADPMLSTMGRAVRDGAAAYEFSADCAVDRCVALTYDDGPSQFTPELLDHLDRARAPATFFMIGRSVEKSPDLARQVADRGYQIGNHTWSHPRLGSLDLAGQAAEVDPTQRVIEEVAGVTPDMLRPPYGSFNDETRWQNLALMFWNVDTNDWNHRSSAKTVSTALEQVRPGSVILMHDLHHASVVATPLLIAELRARGYKVVSLDVLFPARQPGAMYRSVDDTEPPLPPTTVAPTTLPPPPGIPEGTVPPGAGLETPATPPPAGG